jgi:hypothetical protein
MATKEPTNKSILQGILEELRITNEHSLAFETRTSLQVGELTNQSTGIAFLLADANELGAKTLHVMNDLYTFFTGNDMQQAEDRKELLDVLKSLRGGSVTKSTEEKKVEAAVEKPTSGFLKGLLGFLGISALAVLGGLVTGFHCRVHRSVQTDVPIPEQDVWFREGRWIPFQDDDPNQGVLL